MRTRTIAGTTTTAVGSGDLSLVTSAARGVDAHDVERTLHDALALGIAFVDVRDEPDAERLVGDAVRALRLRDRVIVATRVPTLAERPGAPRRDVLPERLPARYVQDRVEAALRTTRLDVLPLAELPLRAAWRSSPAWVELAGTCMRLVKEGKVLAWCAHIDVLDDDAPALATEPWLAAASVVFHLGDRRAEALIAALADKPVTVLARQPLAGGAYGGELGPGVRLPPHDDRNALDAATLTRIATEMARLAPLVRRQPPAATSCEAAKAVLERGRRPEQLEATTVGELALRYVIDRGALALPRLHRKDHVATAIAAAAAPPLPPDLVRRVLDEKPVEGR